MGQKKKRGLVITILVLLIIILLLIAGIAYLYLFTDLLKTNKQLFFQYTAKLVQEQDGFIDNAVMQYFQRKQSSPYETSGDIALDISIPSIEDSLQIVNDFNITYSGKTDVSNAKSENEISINYSDSLKFPFTYRKTNTLTGIQTQYIGGNFVSVKNNEELSGFGDLNRFIKLQNFKFSIEELRNLKTTYFDNILNQLEDSKFSKLTEGELTGYRLTLTEEEFKDTLVQMLEALKTDETTLNKINEIREILGNSSQFDSGTIEDLLEIIQNDLEIGENIQLTVYQNGGNFNRIDIGIGENVLTINKEGNGQEITYSIELNNTKDEGNHITFNAKYTGLGADNVTETYEFVYEGKDIFNDLMAETQRSQESTQIANEGEFARLLMTQVLTNRVSNGNSSTPIELTDIEQELSSGNDEQYTNMTVEQETDTTFKITFIDTGDEFIFDNTGILVEQPETTSQTSSSSSAENSTSKYQYTVTNTIQFVDSVEIEDLTDQNAVILNDKDNAYITNLINAIEQRLTEVNKLQMEELGVAEEANPIQFLLPSTFMTEGTSSSLNEQDVNTFNQKFELYQSTNTKGATVKGLLTTIQNNNETEGNNQIEEINFDGEEYEVTEQNITYLKSSINVEDSYRVEFEKDISTGLIYRAVINKR